MSVEHYRTPFGAKPGVRVTDMAKNRENPVVLSKIYTRTGDDGTTALGDASRTRKTDPRLAAYADVEEANAAIGAALALGSLPEDLTVLLVRVQNDCSTSARTCARRSSRTRSTRRCASTRPTSMRSRPPATSRTRSCSRCAASSFPAARPAPRSCTSRGR